MASFYMDIQAVRVTQLKLVSEKEVLLGELQNLTDRVNNMVGYTWIGPSADKFLLKYECLSNGINRQLDELEQLAQSLNNEIQQWEDMAARMQ